MKGDMTTGSPKQKILSFAFPMLLGVVFQQFYNIADSVIVGRFVSLDALAAVSASYPVTTLFLGIATGGGAGAAILIGYYFGAKKTDVMLTSMRTSVLTFLGLALLLTGGGLLLSDMTLKLLGTPTDIFALSGLYLRIFLYGLPFLFLYNVCNAGFQALGDSITPLALLIFSSILNVLLDLWWVARLHAGVFGAAAATLFSQALAALFAAFLLHRKVSPWKKEGTYFDIRCFRELIGYALPGMLQQSVVAVGQLFMQNKINSFGTAVVAGHAAAFKVNTLVMSSVNALGNALSGYTSQNLGAKQNARIRQGFCAALTATLLMCGSISLFACIFSGNFVSVFLEPPVDARALDTGVRFLHIVGPCYLLLAVKICTDGLMKGLGNMKTFTVATLIDLCVRVGSAFLLTDLLGYTAICLAYPFGWVVGLAITLFVYFKNRKDYYGQ